MEEYIKKSDALAAAKYDYSVWVKIKGIKPVEIENKEEKREEA